MKKPYIPHYSKTGELINDEELDDIGIEQSAEAYELTNEEDQKRYKLKKSYDKILSDLNEKRGEIYDLRMEITKLKAMFKAVEERNKELIKEKDVAVFKAMKLDGDIKKLKEENDMDLRDMRHFQKEFINADHKWRYLEKENVKLKKEITRLKAGIRWANLK